MSSSMEAAAERRIAGEEYLPVYRVVLIAQQSGDPRTWPREVTWVAGGDLVEHLADAERAAAANGRLVAIAVETALGDPKTPPARYQLTWVHGFDPKFPEQLRESAFEKMQKAAQQRMSDPPSVQELSPDP